MVEKTRRQSFSFFTDARACSRYSACRISVPTSLTLSLKFDVYHVFERQMEISVEYYKTKGENHFKTNVSYSQVHGGTDLRTIIVVLSFPEKIYESYPRVHLVCMPWLGGSLHAAFVGAE